MAESRIPQQKHVQDKAGIPTELHFAAIVFSSHYIEGDQRSRDCPGHGYPAHSITQIEYIVFPDRAAMEAWVDKREHPQYGSPDKNYVIIEARQLPVTLKSSVGT